MQALRLVSISMNTKYTVSKSEGVLDGTGVIISTMSSYTARFSEFVRTGSYSMCAPETPMKFTDIN